MTGDPHPSQTPPRSPAEQAAPENCISAAGSFALAYAKLGYYVFPCRPNKRPFTPHGFWDASIDPAVIRAFWGQHPDAQIGIDCGRSGIVVIDLDVKDGVDGTAAFAEILGTNPHGCLLIVATPSGGRHYIYRAIHGIEIKTTAGAVAPGIDTRGVGGYVIAPSPESNRTCLEGDWFELPPGDLAPPPEWVLSVLPRTGNPKIGDAPAEPADLWRGVAEGGRNDAAAQVAGKLMAHGLAAEAWPLLAAWNATNRPPLPIDELRRTYDSVHCGDQQRHPERYAVTTQQPWVRQTLDEVLATSLHPWVVQRYFRAGQLGFLCAFPTVGKSTLVASWIMATLYDRCWAGRRVRGGSVVALVGEGRRGFANRLDAYRQHHRLGPPPASRYIEIVDFKLPLSSPEGHRAVRELIDTITKERGHAPTLIVIDTLSSHWAESEDSAEFGAPAMRALAELAQNYLCAVVVVHHVTKAKGKFVMPELADIRGSSSFACNTDFVFALCATEKDEAVLLGALKLKDDEEPPVIELRRVSVPLGQDEDGELITAAMLEPTGDTAGYDAEATRWAADAVGLNEEVDRLVNALGELGTASKKDAVVLQAHMKAVRGRAVFEIAISRGRIHNQGTRKNPVYVVAGREGGERKNQREGRDVTDVPAPSGEVPAVRDATGRRDASKRTAVRNSKKNKDSHTPPRGRDRRDDT